MTGVSKLNTIPEGKIPRLLIILFAVVILYSSFAIPTGFAETTWQSLGPFGGDISTIAIDPTNSQTVYAGTRSGVFKSTNGGASWTAANNGMTDTYVWSLAIDPTNSQTVYAGTGGGGLFKSTNGGASWTAANSGITATSVLSLAIDPTNNQTLYAVTSGGGVFKSTNGGASWTAANSGMTATAVRSLAIDPTNSQTVYAVTDGKGVFKSTNGGASWTAANSGMTATDVWSLAIDPTNSQTIYVGTYGGVFKSINGGASWTAANSGMTATWVLSLAIGPTNSQTVYAGTFSGGVFKSTNGGASWTAAKSGIAATSVYSLAIDPTNSQTLYAGTDGQGIFKSTNGGASWTAANSGMTAIYVQSIAIDPTNSQTLYAGTSDGVFKSTNGGASWTAANSGMTATAVRSLTIAPTNSQTVYAGTAGFGVFKSTNGGASWTAANSGMTATWVWSLAIDPTNSQTVYAGTNGQGVFKSTNGGASWTAANSGMTSAYVKSLAIDPTNSQTIYAGTLGGGILKSISGGASWTAANSGITATWVWSLAIDPTNSQTLYAGTGGKGVLKTLSSITPTVSAPSSTSFNIGNFGSFMVSASGWPAPTLSVSGTLPNGLSFDPATGMVSGTPLLGSAGTYTLMFTAGNGRPPDASKAVTVTILASSSLNVAISTPTNNAIVTSLTGISGTASGNGLSVVAVQVTDGIYYLQSSGAFSTTPAWLTASGTTSWSLNTSTAAWVEGITYTISARANSGKTTTASFRIQPSAAKQASILSAAFTPDGIRAGDSATISGSLVKGDTTALAGKTVKIIITPPSTATLPNPSPLISTRVTDASGNFTSGTLSSFAAPGIFTVQVRFEGDATYQAAAQSLSLPVVAQSGYAVIVVGKAADNSLLDLHTATATSAYNTLITKRGFLDSNIIPLISSTNSAVTKQQIQDAIGQIKAKYAASPAPFYLIMINHGSQSGFMIGSQTLTPSELGAMMDNFESGISAATLDAHKRFLIVGTCYSGKFQSLSKPGRVIITSSAADEQSLAGSTAYNGATAALSGGDYFMDSFFSFLGRGDNFKDAYDQAATAVVLRDPRKVTLALHSGVVDALAQHPLLDDNGDGAASYRPTGVSDGADTATHYLGEGIRVPAGGNPTDITGVTPMTTLSPAATTATLWLSVIDNSRVSRAGWVEVRTPNTTASGSGTGQVIPSKLDSMELFYDGNKWSGDYSKFSTAGRYDIYYYTRDSQTDDISPMAHSVVYKQKNGNTAPSAFNLIAPDDAATPAPMFPLTWQKSTDPDGLTYTLLVAKDQSFTNIVYREEDIPQAATYTYMPKDALKDPSSATGGYYCQNGDSHCYWKVQAIDSFGATTESNTRSFTIVSTNAPPGYINGFVSDAATGAPVVGANVTAGGSQFTTRDNGGFGILLLSGVYNVTATAIGYQPKTLTNISIAPGKPYDVSMSLESNIPITYNVTPSAGPNGTISPTTVQTVNSGATAAFTITPASGYRTVTPVGGTCPQGTLSGNSYTTGAITGDCTVNASFAPITYSVTPSAGSNGTISPTAIQTVNSGTSVAFTITPASGYRTVTPVGGTCPQGTLTGNSYTTGAITSDCTVNASFAPITYSVTPSAGSNGTISPTAIQTVNSGATAAFTITPVSGYRTVTPVGGTCPQGTLSGNSYTTGAITGDCTVNASFAPITYSVTPSAGSNGTISPATTQTVNGSTTAAFTITPAGGYRTVTPVGGTCPQGTLTGNSYTTGAITGNCAVSASFTPITYNVTPSAGSNGTISPTTAQTVNSGATAAFTITPVNGYRTVTPVGGTCPQGTLTGNSYTTGAITGDCTVNASFASIYYNVTPSAGSNGTISPTTAQTVNSGATAAFTITPAGGYRTVTPVGGTCPPGTLSGNSYTTGAIMSDCTVNASFARTTATGDLTGDGKADLVDAITALQVISNITPPQAYSKEGDVNGDGRIGLPEAIYILQKAAGVR